ncbi:GNAT family N-acetyltransferase [Enterococcus ureasiticus]|uniref:GNAT family N-acetyltransferase n=1 Tax=Enterococcus ureasiticus TaxID=903984 RepID=A0A1E5GPR7_9ENTE|nr:GNAT family N-acetyltransferase [Enterococcus ureasiticus]OEG14220.1 GNAT family N-acetyltransferase [Enterococcus ureasiticus]
MVVYLRKAVSADLSRIMEIIGSARKLLHDKHIPQWQNGEGPNKELLEHDITLQQCYVLIVDQEIAGLGILSTKIETAYEQITNGQWQQTNQHYATIHRVALNPNYQGKGLALLLMNYLITTARLNDYLDIRIDTHPENKTMQQLIKKAGFNYQGDVLLPVSDGERIAYQLVLT